MWVAENLNYKSFEQWYLLSPETIRSYGGLGLLSRFRKNHALLLQWAFPEHQWVRSCHASGALCELP
jgi:hypothetical protein